MIKELYDNVIKFNTHMSEIKTVLELTEEQTNLLKQQVLDLGQQKAIISLQVLYRIEYLALKGLTVDEIFEMFLFGGI